MGNLEAWMEGPGPDARGESGRSYYWWRGRFGRLIETRALLRPSSHRPWRRWQGQWEGGGMQHDMMQCRRSRLPSGETVVCGFGSAEEGGRRPPPKKKKKKRKKGKKKSNTLCSFLSSAWHPPGAGGGWAHLHGSSLETGRG
jgi:hypothetical protein